jgi:hypothetical protein
MILNPKPAPCQCTECYEPEIHVEKIDVKVFYAWVPGLLGSGGWGPTRHKAINAAYGFYYAATNALN